MASTGSPPGPRRERAMTSLKSVVTKERGTLAGDACLVTAAAFGLVMGALALTSMPEGDGEFRRSSQRWAFRAQTVDAAWLLRV